jgi:hypothetical protein
MICDRRRAVLVILVAKVAAANWHTKYCEIFWRDADGLDRRACTIENHARPQRRIGAAIT